MSKHKTPNPNYSRIGIPEWPVKSFQAGDYRLSLYHKVAANGKESVMTMIEHNGEGFRVNIKTIERFLRTQFENAKNGS